MTCHGDYRTTSSVTTAVLCIGLSFAMLVKMSPQAFRHDRYGDAVQSFVVEGQPVMSAAPA